MSKSKELGKDISSLTEEDKAEIVCHIMQAKNRKAQLQIEADLYATTKDVIKEVLKQDGISLKIFNGGRHDKKPKPEKKPEPIKKQSEELLRQEWADLSIPPEDIELECKIITDVQDIPAAEEQLTDEACLEESKKNIDKLIERRRELCAELDQIDTRLRKYTHFYEDLYEELGKEGVEI